MPDQPLHTGGVTRTPVLEPLAEDRARIERIVARLEVTDDRTERADLAAELSRPASRYEHTVEHVLADHPQADGAPRLEPQREDLRDALSMVGSAGEEDRAAIGEQVRKAMKTASERPHPPLTSVGRIVSKLDHTPEDVANPRHTGADTIEGR